MKFVSAGDVINFAIRQEDAASSYYDSAADAVKDLGVKKILRTLAAEEIKHKKCLTDFELGKNPGLDSMSYAIDDDNEEPKDIAFNPGFSKIQILDYAINTEKESAFFYTTLARATSQNEELYKLFLTLAAIENQHIAKLTALYCHPFFKD